MPLSDISSKFIVDDKTLLTFAAEHQLKIDYPDSYESGRNRSGVAVTYFLDKGLITPEIKKVFMVRPFYNDPPHDRPDTIDKYILAHQQEKVVEDMGLFIHQLYRVGLTGMYSEITVHSTYQEILAAWRKELEETQRKMGYIRSPRINFD